MRALLARHDKNKIRSNYENWYYKMAYYLFEKPILHLDETTTNNISLIELYLDEKDTSSKKETRKLAIYLQNKIQHQKQISGKTINSKDNVLIQIADIVAGAITYKERKFTTSVAKLELISHIESLFNVNLSNTTSLYNTKFNLFVWEDQYEKTKTPS